MNDGIKNDLRPFVVVAFARYQSEMRIGYRTIFVSARDENGAIGCGILAMEKAEPDAELFKPAAIEITEEKMAEIGIDARFTMRESD